MREVTAALSVVQIGKVSYVIWEIPLGNMGSQQERNGKQGRWPVPLSRWRPTSGSHPGHIAAPIPAHRVTAPRPFNPTEISSDQLRAELDLGT